MDRFARFADEDGPSEYPYEIVKSNTGNSDGASLVCRLPDLPTNLDITEIVLYSI